MADVKEKEVRKDSEEEKENIIVDIFKKLLEINFTTYGGKGEILK